MGIGKLKDLEKRGDEGLAAAAVLCAELASGCWNSEEEFLESYPSAAIDGPRVRIFVEGDLAVDLTVNFLAGMLMVDNVGSMSRSETWQAPRGRAA